MRFSDLQEVFRLISSHEVSVYCQAFKSNSKVDGHRSIKGTVCLHKEEMFCNVLLEI